MPFNDAKIKSQKRDQLSENSWQSSQQSNTMPNKCTSLLCTNKQKVLKRRKKKLSYQGFKETSRFNINPPLKKYISFCYTNKIVMVQSVISIKQKLGTKHYRNTIVRIVKHNVHKCR